MIKKILSLLIFIFFISLESYAQCAAYTANTACTTTAPTVVNNSISCTPPANNGGRRNFLVTNMIAGATYRVSNCGSGFDTQMTIRNSGGTVVGYNDDDGPACAGTAASIDFIPPANGDYRIQLNRYNCATANNLNGNIVVTLLSNPSPPPSNDDCGGTSLTSNLVTCNNTSGTTIGATSSGLTSCFGSNANDDVWYNFMAVTGTHTISVTEGTLDDVVFEVFSGTCGSLTSELCVDNFFTDESAEITGFIPGNTYYIRVHSYDYNPGTFDICVTHPCLPGNGTGTTTLACPSVDVMDSGGNDSATINCTSPSSVNLEANYLELGETTSYTIENIAYNPPYQFDCLANPISVNDDDVFSPIVNLPFNFCFYGNSYNTCTIGSNGVISFDATLANNYVGWEINNNLPSLVNSTEYFFGLQFDYFFGPSIYGVHHDIDPTAGGEVGWELITLNTGCRALVASWSDVPMYYDPSILYTGMMVLYEDTNVIEIYVEEKNMDAFDPFDYNDVWNFGNAQIGLQNATGTQATVARDVVDGDWTATNQAWRFIPSGNSITDLKWYANSISPANEIIDPNDDGIITVNPTSTTTYIAEVTYNLCDNSTLIETDNFVVTVNGAKIWDGSEATNDWMEPLNWSDDTIPTPADCVIIPVTGNDPVLYTNDDGDGLNLTIHNGATLTIQSDASVTIVDYIDIEATGTLQINDSGSLIQVNDVPTIPNSGNITMDRDANIRRTDYVYWSSPVANFNVGNISTGTPANYIYEWIPTVPNGFTPPPVIPICFGDWIGSSGAMTNGKGYIVRGPNSFTNTPAVFTSTFNGVPNNGVITRAITSGNNTSTNGNFTYNPYGNDLLTVTPFDDNWNLIGNPYPSALDAEAFLTLPSNNIIEGAVHIWTHGSILGSYTDSFYDDYAQNYNISDYTTFNFSGTNTYQDETFSGQIASGQGFFVLALNDSETGSVTFNNSMRQLSANYDNSQFYRLSSNNQSNSSTSSSLEKHRIWLNLIAPSELASSILVGYIENATLEKDRLYDAYNMEVNALNIYSKIGEDRMVIQGRPLPFDENDQVPLGTVVTETGIHTISIAGVDGLFINESQNIYLEDTYTNIIHDLRVSPYTFMVNEPATFDDRFILRYTNEALSIPEYNNSPDITIVAPKGKYIKVISNNETIKNVTVFDLLGRVLIDKKDINQLELILNNISLSDGAYIVKAELYSGKNKVQKVIIKD